MKAETENKPAMSGKPVKETLFVIAVDGGTNCGFIYEKIISHRATEKPVLVLDGQQREELIEYMRRLTQRNYLGKKEKDRIVQLYIPTLETGQIPTSPEAKLAIRSLGCGPWKIPLEIAGYNGQMLTLSTMSARRNGNSILSSKREFPQPPVKRLK